MRYVHSADRALDALREVQNHDVEPADALSTIASVISENLDYLEAVINSQNAGQIANMLVADLYPNDPLSKFILRGLESGSLPELTEEAPDPHAIYRGCAIFAASIRDSYSSDAPKTGGKTIYNLIVKLGCLPADARE